MVQVNTGELLHRRRMISFGSLILEGRDKDESTFAINTVSNKRLWASLL